MTEPETVELFGPGGGVWEIVDSEDDNDDVHEILGVFPITIESE